MRRLSHEHVLISRGWAPSRVVGFALGAYHAPVALSVAIIALVSVGLPLLGLQLGNRLGATVEHRSELVAGIVLICVGVAILTRVL
jgi:putative Mn2+ efflux pump MntP